MLAPGALATWRSLGSYEPDTTNDKEDGWMFTTPNQDFPIVNRVYLNVVATHYMSAVNPNMALEDSRILTSSFTLEAFYGVWVDCNKDGYIGMADTALLEYRAELLPAGHICGAASTGNMHNQQGWVSELRWIGPPGGIDGNDPDELPDSRDGRAIRDFNADIWGDRGLPGDSFSTAVGCKLSYHRTGQALNYADCTLAGSAVAQDTDSAGALLGFQPDGDGNVDYDQAHPANVATFGEQNGNDPAVQVWDCDGGRQGVQTGLGANQGTEEMPLAGGYSVYAVDYTDEQGELNISVWRTYNINGSQSEPNYLLRQDVTYFAPSPSTSPTGSIAGTWNHTVEGAASDCDPETESGYVTYSGQRRHVTDLYMLEDPAVDLREPGKRAVNYEFVFWEEQRSGQAKRGQPFEGGAYPGVRGGALLIASGSRWFGGNEHYNYPRLVRTDLSPEAPRTFTFYANLTDTVASEYALVLPGGGATGIYGDEWCQGAITGTPNGFNCAPGQWYINPDGTRMAGREYAVTAGHSYNLRDIDCYDYRVGNGPAYLSGGALGTSGRCSE